MGLPSTLPTIIKVIVDKLTKLAHFLLGKATYTVDNWAQFYVKKIVRLHGVSMSISQTETPALRWHFDVNSKKHWVLALL